LPRRIKGTPSAGAALLSAARDYHAFTIKMVLNDPHALEVGRKDSMENAGVAPWDGRSYAADYGWEARHNEEIWGHRG
jgi:hypothetical protein